MNRLLMDASDLDGEGTARISGEQGRHLVRVLGVAPGRRIRAGVIDGPSGEARVEAVEGDEVSIRFEPDDTPPVRPRVDLLLAAPRPKVMKRLWAQIAALGVDRILITRTRKVETFYFDSHAYTPEVWRPRLVEGLAQAGDTRLPRVRIERDLLARIMEGFDAWSDADCRVVLHPGEPELLISTPRLSSATRAAIAIGPEGGWTQDELDLLVTHRFHPVGMGMRILRSDTACIAALSALAQRLQAEPRP